MKRSDHYLRLKEQNLSDEEIRRVMERPVPMTIFTGREEKEVNMSPLDSIKHYLRFLNAGVLAVEPRNGAVRVWVGGINHNFFQHDHVKESTQRRVGSTFKPIVYAAALEQGMDPCDYTSAEKTVYTNMGEWTLENTEENYDRKFSMEGALAYSVNTVSVKILERGGYTEHGSACPAHGYIQPAARCAFAGAGSSRPVDDGDGAGIWHALPIRVKP